MLIYKALQTMQNALHATHRKQVITYNFIYVQVIIIKRTLCECCIAQLICICLFVDVKHNITCIQERL